MDSKQQKQVGNHRFSPGYLKPYLDTFINELSKNGYRELTTLNYYNSVARCYLASDKRYSIGTY